MLTLLGLLNNEAQMGSVPMVMLPQNLLSIQHTILEDYETIGDFTFAASGGADTTNFVHGSQSAQFVSPSGGQGYINKVYSPGLDLSSVACIRFYYWIEDLTKFGNSGAVLLSNSPSNFTNGYQYTAFGSNRTGWNIRSLIKSNFSKMGSGDWASTMQQIRWRLTALAGQVLTGDFDYMTAGGIATPVVCLEFDDGYDSVYNLAYPILKAHNIRATCNIISGAVGTANHMTTTQIAELYARGWDMANHTDTSANLTGLSQADAQTRIATGRDYLITNGWTRAANHLTYPGGNYDATVKAAATAEGVLTARGTAAVQGFEMLPFCDPLALIANYSLSSTRTLASVEGAVDTCVSNGYVMMSYGHEIVTSSPSGEQWLDTDLESLVSYMVSAGCQFVTRSELYRLQSGSLRVPKVT